MSARYVIIVMRVLFVILVTRNLAIISSEIGYAQRRFFEGGSQGLDDFGLDAGEEKPDKPASASAA